MKTFFLFCVSLVSLNAQAFSPNEVLAAGQAKRNIYVSDSTVWGGDALANPVNLSSVRWAKNPAGYERIVVDLTGEGSGWQTKSPPYFQVGHESGTNIISLSIHGVSRRNLSSQNLSKSIAKSSLLSQAYIAPGFEGDLASLEFRARTAVDLESFYLVNPPRIVIDVRAKR